jgi:hypothetical protein
VVLADNVLVLDLSLVVCFFRNLEKRHEVVVYGINFSPTLNYNDISYNLFANVENILYSRTMIILRIYYKDTAIKEEVCRQKTQKYEQFHVQFTYQQMHFLF